MKILFFFIIGITLNTSAATIDLTQKLKTRDQLYTRYFAVTFDLSDVNRQSALQAWTQALIRSDKGYLLGQTGVYEKLKKSIKNKQLIDLIAHYNYVGDIENARRAMEFYYFSLITFIIEFSENPLHAQNDFRADAEAMVRSGLWTSFSQYQKCLTTLTLKSNSMEKRDHLTQVQDSCISSQPRFYQLQDLAGNILNNKQYKGPSFVMSYAGFTGGNEVHHLTQNPLDPQSYREIARLNHQILTTRPSGSSQIYSEMTIADFKALMTTPTDALTKFFNKENELPDSFKPGTAGFHPIFAPKTSTGERNIFHEMYQSISNAQQSIFMDVFFLGGSMGAFLAKRIIQKIQSNPALQVFILTDRNNPFSYDNELKIVYNFLKAYSEKFPGQLHVLIPNVKLKRTALPPYIDLLVSDQALTSFLSEGPAKEYTSNLGLYPKAKSDHSKVIVVDGLTDNGVAYFGSKNLTDSSGSVATDESTRVRGPAVKLVLDSYYYDLFEAFRALPNKPSDTNIQSILKPVDVLQRYIPNGRVIAPIIGSTTLQDGQNNVYGTIRIPLEQNLNAILHAKKQIIISDQFLYSPDLVRALRYAVMNNPQLKVYVVLNPLDDPLNSLKAFAHVPNNIYIEDLTRGLGMDGRIQVKWRIQSPERIEALKVTSAEPLSQKLSPEYHLKTISVDGVTFDNRTSCKNISNNKQTIESPDVYQNLGQTLIQPQLISGSANKDHMTMTGGFREFQAVLFDKNASIKHDCLFWSRWDDPTETEVAVGNQFIVPKALAERGLEPGQLILILKAIIEYGYNFSEKYF